MREVYKIVQLDENQSEKRITLDFKKKEEIMKLYDSCGWIDMGRLYVIACKHLKRPLNKELVELLNDLDDSATEFGNTNLKYQIQSIVRNNADYMELIIEDFIGRI